MQTIYLRKRKGRTENLCEVETKAEVPPERMSSARHSSEEAETLEEYSSEEAETQAEHPPEQTESHGEYAYGEAETKQHKVRGTVVW